MAAHSMIQGRRLGRPLLGKWHLCSFVVSVIGLSTLSADSSPREAPPACQLHSIRKPRLLLFTVQTPSLTLLLWLLIYIQLELHCDLCRPLVTPTERRVPASFFSSSLLYVQIIRDILHLFLFFLLEYWFQGRMLAASFIPFFILLSSRIYPLQTNTCIALLSQNSLSLSS